MGMNNIDNIKKILEENVLLFSDLHIGNNSNSTSYHKICIDYSLWLKQKAIENNINTFLFLGDFFHDREEINLLSLNTANEFLQNLKEFNIILIVGNHDCYYKDNAEIHSLSIFNQWKNIIVVDQLTVFDYLDKKIALLPWGFEFEKVPFNIDYCFGHLTIESFRINKIKICEKSNESIKSADVLEKIKKVFSGHFHIRSKKDYNNGSILYIGNTFEQNWSDYEEKKGIEIFNFVTGDTKFIENDFSPKHIKLHLSKILSKDQDELQILKTKFKNNFTKLIIDEDIDMQKLSIISDKLANLKPLEFNSEFLVENDIKNANDFDSVEIEMELLLTEYINNLEIHNNKDKILKETLNLYQKALKEVNI